MAALPSMTANATRAARKGPQLAIGTGIEPNACRAHGHQDRRMVNTRSAINGCRLTMSATVRTPPRPPDP